MKGDQAFLSEGNNGFYYPRLWSMLKKNETVVIGYKLAPDDDEIVGQEYDGRPSISF